MQYKVIEVIDETGEEYFIGQIGEATGHEYDGMIELKFSGGDRESYWPEELEEVGLVGEPDWEI
jgi:hypothetical protein